MPSSHVHRDIYDVGRACMELLRESEIVAATFLRFEVSKYGLCEIFCFLAFCIIRF